MLYRDAPMITEKSIFLIFKRHYSRKCKSLPFKIHTDKNMQLKQSIKFGGLLWESFPQKLLCIWLLTLKHTFNHGMTPDHRKLPEIGNDSKEVPLHTEDNKQPRRLDGHALQYTFVMCIYKQKTMDYTVNNHCKL